ncbi:MAG TPA: amino acid adenylation domain-containing protein [Polyangia bacterium]|nr:amino acid adenylation domain-containing protein [Polyangia bacterium]
MTWLSPDERATLLQVWSDGGSPDPRTETRAETFPALFEEVVARAPDATALVSGPLRLTYGELNARADALAVRLRRLGVGPDVLVGICTARGAPLVEAVLAIMKAGGAYVPLDPEHPADRLAYMVSDSAPAAIVVDADGQAAVSAALGGDRTVPLIFAGDLEPPDEADDPGVRAPASRLAPQHLAYVIYTSGSSGRPKGVLNEQRGLVNLSRLKALDLGPGSHVLQFASPSFDASTWELAMALGNGATLHLATRDQLMPGRPLIETIEREGITHLLLPPSALAACEETGLALGVKTLLVGGEAIRLEDANRWAGRVRLINAYGPTEATVCTCIHECRPGAPVVPIGRPLPNTCVYILDRAGQPVPVGVSGEIHIGGAGVARGYLNRPELTAALFVPDPFAGDGERSTAKMYRTGDIGRWLPDGSVEFIGRNDLQVKVRGFRIELGEIEARLADAPGIAEVAVLAREDQPGDKRLVAYYRRSGDGADTGADALRAHARQRLPEYMVPSAYVSVEAFPLTTSGKIDRQALPAPERSGFGVAAYEEPRGDLERTVAEIWRQVLRVERVGRQDDFFELGGHSLLAVKVVEQLRRAGLGADVRSIFAAPKLEDLAQSLAAASAGGTPDVQLVPPNLIPGDATAILPAMLPLVDLDEAAIERIVAVTPGGAANVQDIYPLAPLQEGILFHHLMGSQADTYLLPTLLAFPSRARLDRFLGTLQTVIDRHDILRTAVIHDGLPQPVQVVRRRARLNVEPAAVDAGQGDVAEQMKAAFRSGRYRVRVDQAPLLRAVVAEDPARERWLLLVVAHHLAMDHATLELLVAEADLIETGRQDQLPVPVPFRNFVAQAQAAGGAERDAPFFQEMLGDVDEPTAPFGLLSAPEARESVAEYRHVLPRSLTAGLRRAARALGVSPATLVHLAYGLVVGRASGRREVVFGTVLLGRMQAAADVSRVVGMFINTLPVRIDLDGARVSDAVRRVHSLLMRLIEHEHASLALAQRASRVPAPAPLFSALLNYRHSPGADPSDGGVVLDGGDAEGPPGGAIEELWTEERTSYPFTLSVDDLPEDFALTALVAAPVAPERVCAMMERALIGLVDALERAPDSAVGAIDVLPSGERRQLLEEWNATAAEYPDAACIHDLIAAQAARTPEAVALELDGHLLTYGTLETWARQVAGRLRALGVGPGTRVAVCAERSFEMIVALVATMKAGGAYVPLDPTYPSKRLGEMLADSAPVVALTHGPARDALQAALDDSGGAVSVIDLAHDVRGSAAEDIGGQDLGGGVTARDLAYVIYTSGSTGTPKGAMNEHRAVVNRLVWLQRHWQLGPGDVFLHKTPFTFDVSVGEIFCPLISGGRLVIARPDGHKNPAYLAEVIEARGVNVVHFVPSMLQQFLDHQGVEERCMSLRRVMCSGEALPAALVRRFHERLPGVELLNLYGPTEAAVEVLSWPCRPDDAAAAIPIGRPIANAKVYVLDRALRPAPVGVAGELCIGGVPVGRGYLNRPELTAEKFVADPFADEPGARLYKTGDLARWRADGVLEYLGRNDLQVKVRGFRIELGEIEARLADVEGVKEAVVLAREDRPGDQRLVAYYTALEPFTEETLRAALRAWLPDHMVPWAFVHLETLPLNASGKVDRKSLPAVGGAVLRTRPYEAPRGPIETTLAEIWAETLKVERVGREDNFFMLGGHSLSAMTVVERMRRAGLAGDVRALFTTATLADLARRVGGGARAITVPPNGIPGDATAITPEMLPLVSLDQPAIDRIVAKVPGGAANVQDIYPLAPLQEGILFHHLVQTEGDPYLLSAVLAFPSRERLQGFTSALQQVIDRHDILRTAVMWEGLSEPVQVVLRSAQVRIEELAVDRAPAADADAVEQLKTLCDPRRIRMDVSTAPLVSGYALPDPAGERWLLMVLAHHLAIDHTTLELMVAETELIEAGRADELSPPIPFRTFVAEARLGVTREEHEAHFRALLGDVTEPTMPFGLADVRGDGRTISEAQLMLDRTLSSAVHERARQVGVSAASLVHLAWAMVVARTTGRRDVTFGTVLFGRMQGGNSPAQVLGMFINTLPVRFLVAEQAVELALLSAHEQLAALLTHEHASLVLAQRCSGVPAGSPLFTSLLNYRHTAIAADPEPSGQEPQSEGEDQPAPRGVETLWAEERTNYPLTLSVDSMAADFKISAQVSAPIDPERVCAMMARALQRIVDALEYAPTTPMEAIDILGAEERRLVLVEWNATARPYPRDATLGALFDQQAQRNPDGPAVIEAGAVTSYVVLGRRADRLARALLAVGTQPGDRVAVALERSASLVAAELGVVKAGAAYVPLDPVLPGPRQALMVADCGARVIVTSRGGSLPGELAERIAAGELRRLNIDEMPSDDSGQLALPADLTGGAAAYVMYTSGSTGAPRGVVVPHRAVSRLVLNNGYANFDAGDRVAFASNPSFDASTLEVWAPLLNGGCVVVIPQEVLLTPAAFAEALLVQRVSVLWMTVGLFNQYHLTLSGVIPALRYLIVGGDALDVKVMAQVLHGFRPQHLLNGYGPTETTTFALTHEIVDLAEGARSVPLGRPIGNTRVYILDQSRRPTPIGVAGEIYIGGDGVADGYLNQAEQTADRFLADPFSGEPGGRMYQTGDLGRWQADGTVEYLGRNDFQVKLRGFRIELGEVEARLGELEGVTQVVSVVREDQPGARRLVAYYTGAGAPTAAALRAYARAVLPQYMVPAAFVFLPSLPLNANGKVDRQQLPPPAAGDYLTSVYAAPENEIEETIARLCSELLGADRVGRDDSFFELGGHSLLAVQLVGRIEQELGVLLPLSQVFLDTTVAGLGASVVKAQLAEFDAGELAELMGKDADGSDEAR